MTRPLRIVLNANVMLAPLAGIGQYVSELGQALQKRDDVRMHYVYGLQHGDTLPDQGLKHYSALRDLAKRLLPSPYRLKHWLECHALERAIRQQDGDLYHEPSIWPRLVKHPTVMTLHDLTHVHFPHTQPADRLRAIEHGLNQAFDRACRILCVSEFTARQAVEYYGLSPQRISVTPLGVSSLFQPRTAEHAAPLLQALGLDYRSFLLCVGTLEPRKNLDLVLQAVRRLPTALFARCPLVLCGARGWGEVPAALEELERRGHLVRTGYLPRRELSLLMGSARMLLFPSLYEGFGLPILEAMASGTPVITSNCAAMPEVGGNAACYVDPEDAEGLAEAIRLLYDDLPCWQRYRQAGLERAQGFSWSRTAEQTMAAYRAALV